MFRNSKTSFVPSPNRRQFIRQTAAVAAGAGLALGGAGSVLADVPEPVERSLRLVNAHTWEKLEVTYCRLGIYEPDSLVAINNLMRDHRQDEATEMDVDLLNDLFRLHNSLPTDEAIHVLSGYRTPETNAILRKRSRNVAKYSLHMAGKAADIYIPGIKTSTLEKAALAMQSGGVGYYGRSGFVHIDTGHIRHWGRG